MTVSLSEPITLYISIGTGSENVEIPDVRGFSPETARAALEEAGLWVDPTQAVDGTITSQNPASGTIAPMGTEVRLYSEPLPTEIEAGDIPPIRDIEEGIPVTDDLPQQTTPPETPPRDPNQTDW